MRHGLDGPANRVRKRDGGRGARARLAWAGLLLAAAPAFGADHPAAWSPLVEGLPRGDRAESPIDRRGPDLVLVWFDPHALLPRGHTAVARVVNDIFGAAGIDVGWRAGGLRTAFGGGPVPEVGVILLPEDPARQRRGRHVMGLVMREPTANRAIWVFLSSVRRAIGLDARAEKAVPEREAEDVGRALGRVVAHEVFHAFAPDEPHSRSGLMHGVLDRSALLDRTMDLDKARARAFRTRLAAFLPPTEPSPAPLLPLPWASDPGLR